MKLFKPQPSYRLFANHRAGSFVSQAVYRYSVGVNLAKQLTSIGKQGSSTGITFVNKLRPLPELKESPAILDQLEARRVEFEQ